MIDGLRNHPCIVMWVPFNEGWGQYDTARIVEMVKKQDPTRLVELRQRLERLQGRRRRA